MTNKKYITPKYCKAILEQCKLESDEKKESEVKLMESK